MMAQEGEPESRSPNYGLGASQVSPAAPTSSSGEEEYSNQDKSNPKYEFNYDIPKDSFQSDIINGQFSTFAKLPMSFESLIQSDASFLDTLSEHPPPESNKERSQMTEPASDIPRSVFHHMQKPKSQASTPVKEYQGPDYEDDYSYEPITCFHDRGSGPQERCPEIGATALLLRRQKRRRSPE